MTNSSTTDLTQRGAPPDVAAAVQRLTRELADAAGENLAGLVLYGPLARGRYRPGRGDVNVLVLFRDASAASLSAAAPALQAAWREAAVEPFILAVGELPRAAEAFPQRFLDIRHHHVVLAGDDPLAGLTVSRRAVLLRAEQELRSVVMRLRRRYVALHDDPEDLEAVFARAAAPVATALAGMLQLQGHSLADDGPDIEDAPAGLFDQAAAAFDLDREALSVLARLREDPDFIDLPAGMLDRMLQTIQRAADKAGILETA